MALRFFGYDHGQAKGDRLCNSLSVSTKFGRSGRTTLDDVGSVANERRSATQMSDRTAALPVWLRCRRTPIWREGLGSDARYLGENKRYRNCHDGEWRTNPTQ